MSFSWIRYAVTWADVLFPWRSYAIYPLSRCIIPLKKLRYLPSEQMCYFLEEATLYPEAAVLFPEATLLPYDSCDIPLIFPCLPFEQLCHSLEDAMLLPEADVYLPWRSSCIIALKKLRCYSGVQDPKVFWHVSSIICMSWRQVSFCFNSHLQPRKTLFGSHLSHIWPKFLLLWGDPFIGHVKTWHELHKYFEIWFVPVNSVGTLLN